MLVYFPVYFVRCSVCVSCLFRVGVFCESLDTDSKATITTETSFICVQNYGLFV